MQGFVAGSEFGSLLQNVVVKISRKGASNLLFASNVIHENLNQRVNKLLGTEAPDVRTRILRELNNNPTLARTGQRLMCSVFVLFTGVW